MKKAKPKFSRETLELVANMLLFADRIYSKIVSNRETSYSEEELMLKKATAKDLEKILSYEENCGSPSNIAYYSEEKKAIVTRDLTVWVKYNDRFY